MKPTIVLGSLAWAALWAQAPEPFRVRVSVPGTSNPYLAGMPKGTKADVGDRAPQQSPVVIKLPAGATGVTFAAVGEVDRVFSVKVQRGDALQNSVPRSQLTG